MVDMGVCRANEYWKINKALYGLPSSPAWWAAHRDEVVSTFSWTSSWNDEEMEDSEPTKDREKSYDHVVNYEVEKSGEPNLWLIWGTENEEKTLRSTAVMYVDDMMISGNKGAIAGFINRVQKQWKTSEPERVDRSGWVRFCGFELQEVSSKMW